MHRFTLLFLVGVSVALGALALVRAAERDINLEGEVDVPGNPPRGKINLKGKVSFPDAVEVTDLTGGVEAKLRAIIEQAVGRQVQTKWEYQVVEAPEARELQKFLNAKGEQNWELALVTNEAKYLFKRPRP